MLALTGRMTVKRLRGWGLLAAPGILFLLVLFGWPLADMAILSLTTPSPSNYAVFAESPVYLDAYVTTFVVALVTTGACLLLGYPYAYLMHTGGRTLALILGFFVLLPFWSSILVRTFAWSVWLQDTGIVNTTLLDAGVIDRPLPLIRNALGTTIGMTHVLLPFMVLSLYAGMRRIDPNLTRAAMSLGASPLTAFRRIFLPLSMAGIYAGSLIVLVISLGFYLTPAVLGDPGKPLIGQLIVEQVTGQLNFGVGGALGVVLLVATLAVVWAGTWLVDLRSVMGYEE
ncbi:ABC transporter permease [Actinomadura spongiicola]|uniref:ABC transporter permease n=1 Tax=Actinomadura spongiicola TaxID=2303421 RepID=A0A372GGJ3_9ACTN|nr:ABC transporter permease [Actinomadura spongiicola]RFS84302.1 ABC transporter permease [Actinomadura spongiicola]